MTVAENSREIVLDILLALERGEDYSHRLIRAVLDKYDYLDSRDKAFIKRVSEGTIERQIELDYDLEQFSSVPVRKMKPLIRCLMRMSLYQILYMDNVPDSAACNEACKLAVKRNFKTLKGFVNGVLRNLARNKENLPFPDKEREPVRYLSVRYSMPEWIVSMWIKQYGQELAETILGGLMEIHPVSLRFRTDLTVEEREALCEEYKKAGLPLEKSDYLDFVYLLEHAENPERLPGFREGKCTIQDVSSALLVMAASITGEDFVLDVCAAPGGKTMLAAERAAKVLARDVSEEKTGLIRENCHRMKLDHVVVETYDARVPDEALFGKADVVLADVPCSGLGVIGKKRDIKYHVTKEGIEELSLLQKQIVKNAVKYTKPGGVFLYSTCTINRTENEEMVRYITEELGMKPESLKGRLPEGLQSLKVRGKDCGLTKEQDSCCIQLLPGIMKSDGFFIAGFRNGESGS